MVSETTATESPIADDDEPPEAFGSSAPFGGEPLGPIFGDGTFPDSLAELLGPTFGDGTFPESIAAVLGPTLGDGTFPQSTLAFTNGLLEESLGEALVRGGGSVFAVVTAFEAGFGLPLELEQLQHF